MSAVPVDMVQPDLTPLGGISCTCYLDELCSEWRVNGIKYKLAVLESLSADWTLPLCVVHANGSAVHENIGSDLPTADSFQGSSFCVAAQRSCQVICFLLCPAKEECFRPNFRSCNRVSCCTGTLKLAQILLPLRPVASTSYTPLSMTLCMIRGARHPPIGYNDMCAFLNGTKG